MPFGADVAQTIDLRLVATTFRLQTATGTPASRVPLSIAGPFRRRHLLGTTSDVGTATVPKLAAGTYTLLARRRSLSGQETLEQEWLAVGTITVSPGQSKTFDLTLPPEWDR